MMPDSDGFEVLEDHPRGHDVPVIMLTARVRRMIGVPAPGMGADDYITTTIPAPRELVSRVNAVPAPYRRRNRSMHGLIEVDNRLKITFDRREIWLEGKLVKLRPKRNIACSFHLVPKCGAGWFP